MKVWLLKNTKENVHMAQGYGWSGYTAKVYARKSDLTSAVGRRLRGDFLGGSHVDDIIVREIDLDNLTEVIRPFEVFWKEVLATRAKR
jgi:hypothetical protein